MALDCLYGAMLKLEHPYEFYLTLLKNYTKKGQMDKIAKAISEMNAYKGIRLISGSFGEDNSDWSFNKEHKTISQSLSSIKYISTQAAKDLYEISKLKEYQTEYDMNNAIMPEGKTETQKKKKAIADEWLERRHDHFVDLMRKLQVEAPSVNTRVIKILIALNYFSSFGPSGKLMKMFDAFNEGSTKIAAKLSLVSVAQRMKEIETLVENDNSELPIAERLSAEFENVGLCMTTTQHCHSNDFFVEEVDDKYGFKMTLYSLMRGTRGQIRVRKTSPYAKKLQAGMVIRVHKGEWADKIRYKNGQKKKTGEREYWLENMEIVSGVNAA